MSLPNWFFAFPFDGGFLERLPRPPANFRLYHPEDVHITLIFLGSCGEAAALRGLEALDAQLAAERPQAIHVSLGEVVAMGPKRKYSALSALLNTGRTEAEACIERLRHTISEAAIGRRQQREPKPHATVARPARRASPEDRANGLRWALGLDLRDVDGTLSRIALYTWHPERPRRLFQIVAERPLAWGCSGGRMPR